MTPLALALAPAVWFLIQAVWAIVQYRDFEAAAAYTTCAATIAALIALILVVF